jgi:hypothetical protein
MADWMDTGTKSIHYSGSGASSEMLKTAKRANQSYINPPYVADQFVVAVDCVVFGLWSTV